MKRIVAAIILGITLALALMGGVRAPATGGNWNSGATPVAVNWYE